MAPGLISPAVGTTELAVTLQLRGMILKAVLVVEAAEPAIVKVTVEVQGTVRTKKVPLPPPVTGRGAATAWSWVLMSIAPEVQVAGMLEAQLMGVVYGKQVARSL